MSVIKPGSRRPALWVGLALLAALGLGRVATVSRAGERKQPPAWRATLVPVRRCQLASRAAGIVEEFLVEEGARFKARQPLVKLRSAEAQAGVEASAARAAEARALLLQARGEAGSLRLLLAREAATRRELNRAEAQIAVAEARLAEAEAVLARARMELEACTLLAPWDGVLLLQRRQPGESVRVQGELCDLADPSQLYAVVQMPQEQIQLARPGARAWFVPEQGPEREGVVVQVGAQVEPGSRSVRVKILLDNADGAFWPGAGGTVRLEGP